MINAPTKFDGISTLPADEYNNITSELKNIVTTGGQSLTSADVNQLAKSIANYVSNGTYYTDSGVANAYVLTTVGAKNSPTSYTNGLTARFKVGNANSGSSTINVASLGVKNIKKNNGANNLVSGDLPVNTIVEVVYDSGGDYFELVSTEFVANSYLRKDQTANISVGYTYTAYGIGNSGTGTVTPLISNGPFQTITINGSFTLAAPTDTNSGTIEIVATNDGTGGYTITVSAYTIIENNYDNSANKVNIFKIEKVGSTSYLRINPVPIATTTQNSTYNAVINGGMGVWQRGTSFATIADATYTADRWRYTKLVTTGVQTVSQSSSVPTPDSNTPLLNYSLLLTNTTADASIAAGKLVTIAQRIEGFNFEPLAQRTMTLSFWVKSSVTGTYCVGVKNSGADRSYVAEYVINSASTWERKTISITASPSAGTWDYTTGIGLNLNFTLMCGSTYQTSAGSWQTGDFSGTSNQTNFLATNSATFAVTAVQLESNSSATPFINDSRTKVIENCERYFCKSFNIDTAPAANTESGLRIGFGNTTAAAGVGVTPTTSFQTRMRATPTITTYDPYAAGSDINNSTGNICSGTAAFTASPVSFSLSYTVGAGNVTGTNLGFHYTANSEL